MRLIMQRFKALVAQRPDEGLKCGNRQKFQVTASNRIEWHQDKNTRQFVDHFVEEKRLLCSNKVLQTGKEFRAKFKEDHALLNFIVTM